MDEALRLVRNIIKIGQVNSIDPGQGTIQVLFPDKDNQVSDDLPVLNFEYNMPQVGDQVVCIFLGNGMERGVCLGSFYSEISPPPVQDANIYRKQLDSDVYIEYNRSSKQLTVKGNLTVQGNISATGTVTGSNIGR